MTRETVGGGEAGRWSIATNISTGLHRISAE